MYDEGWMCKKIRCRNKWEGGSSRSEIKRQDLRWTSHEDWWFKRTGVRYEEVWSQWGKNEEGGWDGGGVGKQGSMTCRTQKIKFSFLWKSLLRRGFDKSAQEEQSCFFYSLNSGHDSTHLLEARVSDLVVIHSGLDCDVVRAGCIALVMARVW